MLTTMDQGHVDANLVCFATKNGMTFPIFCMITVELLYHEAGICHFRYLVILGRPCSRCASFTPHLDVEDGAWREYLRDT